MKKVFTLLMLLCMVCTGAWAQPPFTFTSWTHEGWTTMGTKGTNVTSEIKDVIYKVYENKTLSGNLRVTIKYQQGNRRRYINGVELLQNNQVVYSKYERKHDNADATGAVYEIANVAEGNYTVRIWSSRNTDNEWADNKTRVNITAGETAIVTNDDVLVGDWLTGDNSVLTDGLKAVCTSVGLGLKDGKLKYQEEVVTFTTAGKGTVSYNYTGASGGGNERLDILGFEVLNQEGTQVVSSDAHYGYTGSEHSNCEYTYNIPAAGTYKVRTWVDGVRELKSQGTVTYTFSTSTAYSVESNLTVGGVTYTSESAVGSNENVTNGNSVYTSANSIQTSELTPISVQGYVPAVIVDETGKNIKVTYTLKEGLYNLRTAFTDGSKYGVVSSGTTLKLTTADAAPDAFIIVPSEKTNATVKQPTYYIKTTDETQYWTYSANLGSETEVLILDKNATGINWNNATPADGFFAIVALGQQGRALAGKPNSNVNYGSRDLPAVYYGQNATNNYSYSWVIEEVNNDPVTSLSQLSNNRAYTITSYARGQWTAVEGKSNIYQTKGTEQNNWGNASGNYTPINTDANDANQQWAILKSAKGNYYLYNVGQKKFFVSQENYATRYSKATLADTPNSSGFTLVDRSSALGSQSFYTGSEQTIRWGVGMNVNNTDYFFGVTNWQGQSWMAFQNNEDYNKNSDAGMYFKLVPVEGSFNFSDAMEKIRQFELEPITYTLASAGTPDGASVTIKDQTYTGINDQGITLVTTELSLSDIKVSCSNGYIYNVLLDNNNHQINVAFKQLFIPAESTSDVANTYYIYDTGKRYVTINGSNILYTKGRNGADKFIFLEDTENAGKYFIYDVTAQKYLYWTAASASQNVQQTSGSKIQFTSDAATANSWGILGEDYDITGVDIFAGSVDLSTVVNSTQGWNFRGGDNYVLNFFNRDDNRSSWKIQDSSVGSLSCATLVYSLPGEEFMHKLVPEDGVTVESVDFGDITSLTLKDDRARYKYVSGIAPTEEGTYTYTVTLSDGSKAKVTLKVDKFLQSPTPFMGWLSWNWFQRGINATNMTAIAQGLKDKGLVDAGFTTLVLDDTWANQTSNKAALDWNSTKFPNPTAFVNGIKNLGLKVGLYSDAGSLTCEKYQPGSYGYEAQHMAKFDQWGIDFLKYDRCNAEGGVVEAYSAMGREIEKVNVTRKANGGVPFMYNACEWGDNQPWTWAAEAGASSWRSCHDVREDWCGNNSRPGVIYASDVTREYWMYAGVNRYNDLDMMCIGLHGIGGPSNNTANHQSNGGKITGLTTEQARSQMSIWCMFASPLSLTADVRQNPSADGNSDAGTLPNPLITDDDLAILTNKDIIAINQDALGQQAEYMPNLSSNDAKGSTTGYSVYLKDLKGGDRALAIVNRSGSATMSAKTINLDALYLDANKSYYVKDVWAGTVQTCTGSITTTDFKASETKVYIISEVVEAKVSQPESGHTGGLNGKYVGTFSSSFNVELPEGYKAFTAVVDGNNVTFTHLGEEGNRLVPANTGVLLFAEEGVEAQNATPVRFADVEVGDNAFRPTTGGEIPVGSYILANKPAYEGVCFYPINPAARTVAKGKAYLELPTTPGVQAYAFGFDFEQGATTGIASQQTTSANTAAYDLQGRRISTRAKGVSIVGGNKVIR